MRRNSQLSPVRVSYMFVAIILMTFVMVAQDSKSQELRYAGYETNSATASVDCSQWRNQRATGCPSHL